MSRILEKATDPLQYDNPDLSWLEVGSGLDSPLIALYWQQLLPHAQKWAGKDLLDIGSGSGWLLNEVVKLGVRSAIGIEPSVNSCRKSHELYPSLSVVNTTLERYQTDELFDIAVSVMSLNHIRDVSEALQKVRHLLEYSGEFWTIVPDFDYFRIERHGYEIEVEELSDNEYVTQITRPGVGTMSDVIRTIDYYGEAATDSGLMLALDIPHCPSDEFILHNPRFAEFAHTPIWHVLRFDKE